MGTVRATERFVSGPRLEPIAIREVDTVALAHPKVRTLHRVIPDLVPPGQPPRLRVLQFAVFTAAEDADETLGKLIQRELSRRIRNHDPNIEGGHTGNDKQCRRKKQAQPIPFGPNAKNTEG